MSLQRIQIKGLFGTKTRNLYLRETEPILLLHGENGVGKSTMLELVAYSLTPDLSALASLPFSDLILEWKSSQMVVSRNIPDTSKPLEGTLKIALNHEGLEQQLEFPLSHFWRSDSDSESTGRMPEIKWLHDFCAEHPVLLLASDRLSGAPGIAVNRCARDMRERLAENLDSLLRQNMKKDFQFLAKLTALPKATSDEDLKIRLDELRELLNELERLGLLDPIELPEEMPPLSDPLRTLVQAYMDQQLSKLDELRTLRDQTRQLLRLLHRRLRLKQLRLDRRLGYAVVLASGNLLPLERLSSGEQHLIVLFHRLLFETTPNTLILLDEPELSWHVEWQYSFIDDLLRLTEMTGGQFLISTHSPQIVGNHWDRTLEITD